MTQQRMEEVMEEPFGNPMPGEETPTAGPEAPTAGSAEENLQSLVRRYIELHRRKRERRDEEKIDNAELERLEPVIAQQFAVRQIQNQKTTSGETVYVQQEIWASLVTDEDGTKTSAHEALRKHDLEWLVEDNVNGNRLSSWVRERVKNNEEIDEELLPFLKISKPYRVKVRL